MHWGALPVESARGLMTSIDVVCWFTCWPCQLYSCSHSTNTLGCTCNCLQNAEHAVHWSTARVKNEWRSCDQTLTVMTTFVVRGLDGRTQATCPVGCIACVACVSHLSGCRVCLRNQCFDGIAHVPSHDKSMHLEARAQQRGHRATTAGTEVA